MGFQGQLSSVNLTDIFQTLHMNRQSGTLSVTGPEAVLHAYFENGCISLVSAPQVGGVAYLLAALVRKGLIDGMAVGQLHQQLLAGNQSLRQIVRASGMVGEPDLDEVSTWCGEELVCPIFDWHEGEFTFADGAPVRELSGPDVVEMGPGGLPTTALLLEASRRNDEWKRIREVITDTNALFTVDQDGRANLANLQTDPDMLKVLRYLDGRRTLDAVAEVAGLSRFDTYAITAQLVLAGVARPRSPEEVLDDALALRQQGDVSTAHELLEITLKSHNVPEVIRPLAEISVELRLAPRAVELFLELIQISQDQGDLEQALADLNAVLALSPDDPDLQIDRAKVLGELGRAEESAAAFTAAAQGLLATRDIQRAVDACHRAKNLLPRSPDPHRFLAKAYLLDGQTENALVEYKALWHALLSLDRPRKALEIFKEILDSDCRFSGIKEQALSHAQNSEAIKTSKAMRWLIYLVCVFMVVAGILIGVQFYLENVVKTDAKSKLGLLKTVLSERINRNEHVRLIDDINNLRNECVRFDELASQCEQLSKEVKLDYESRADVAQQTADALLAGGQFEPAKEAYRVLEGHFPGTKAAGNAKARIEQVRQGEVGAQVQGIIDDAQARWTNLDWDAALTTVLPLTKRQDLPNELRTKVSSVIGEWKAKLASAQALYERAEAIEKMGRKKEALVAYRLASGAAGEESAARARERLTALEVSFARELAEQMRQSFDRGDDRTAFQIFADMRALAKAATGKSVADYVARLGMPFTVKVDGHQTILVMKRSQPSEPVVVRAPAGTRGAWSHSLQYAPDETVTIEARRRGFVAQTLSVDIKARVSSASITLTRGWLWQKDDIEGMPMTAPVAAGKFILMGTDRSTLEVIDPGLGNHRPITFPQSVDEFRASPMVYQNLAWTVLDHRAWAIDLATRTPAWIWPPAQGDSPLRLAGWFWVQDHELIPGQSLLFLAGLKGTLHALAIDKGRSIPYPVVDLGSEVTGALVGAPVEANRTLLYVPTGNHVQIFDTASTTEHQAPIRLFTIKTRGDIIGTMVPAQVAEQKALLALDNSGLLVALAVTGTQGTGENRALASWSLEGSGIDRAVVGGKRAFVSLAEGRVVAVDLAKPGVVLWRYPAQDKLSGLSGAPALGKNGLYVADTTGALHCLDPETGVERWRTELGSQVRCGILAFDGRIYVPTRKGTLVCFEEGDE